MPPSRDAWPDHRGVIVQDEPHRYPGWVLAVSAVVFGVVVTGIVVELYSRHWIPLAGPFVLLGWMPVLLWLQRAGIRFRTRRGRRLLTEKLGNLSRLVADERNRPPGERASGATDGSLAQARELVARGGDLLAANRGDTVAVVGALGPVAARWHPDAALTRALLEACAAAQKLTVAWGEAVEEQARA